MEVAVPLNDKERRRRERRSVNRITSGERRSETDRSQSLKRPGGRYYLALQVFVSVLAGVLGFGVLLFTGLFSGASTTIAQSILVFAIVFVYVTVLRRALY